MFFFFEWLLFFHASDIGIRYPWNVGDAKSMSSRADRLRGWIEETRNAKNEEEYDEDMDVYEFKFSMSEYFGVQTFPRVLALYIWNFMIIFGMVKDHPHLDHKYYREIFGDGSDLGMKGIASLRGEGWTTRWGIEKKFFNKHGKIMVRDTENMIHHIRPEEIKDSMNLHYSTEDDVDCGFRENWSSHLLNRMGATRKSSYIARKSESSDSEIELEDEEKMCIQHVTKDSSDTETKSNSKKLKNTMITNDGDNNRKWPSQRPVINLSRDSEDDDDTNNDGSSPRDTKSKEVNHDKLVIYGMEKVKY